MQQFFLSLGPMLGSMMGLIGVYVILALSLNMINGMAGMFSIGQAGFWAIGAYSAGAMMVHNPFGTLPYLTFALGLLLAVALAAVAGLLLALSCVRLAGDYLAIATLGFSIIVVSLLYNMDFVGAATGLSLPVYASQTFVWVVVAAVLLLYYRLQFSNYGRVVMALREDEIAAQSIGINRVYFKTLVFVLGSAVAGLAGGVYAGFATYLNPSGFEFDQSIKILTMVVLGGLGSLTGVTVAAIALTVVPEVLRLVGLADYQMVIFASVLLLMVLLRPQGIIGGKELWDLPFFKRFWRPHGMAYTPPATDAGPQGPTGVLS